MDKIYLKDNYIVTELSGVTAVFGKNYTVYSENTTTFFLNSSFPINNARSVTIDFSRSSTIFNEAGTVAYTTATLRAFFLANTGFKSPVGGSTGITVGTTPITSGVDGRVLFQSGGVVSQDSGFFWNNTLKRLSIPAGLLSRYLFNPSATATWIEFQPSVHQINFTINGGEAMRISNTRNIGIGTTSPSARLDVRAQGALSTDNVIRARNSVNTADLFRVNGQGTMLVGLQASAPTGVEGAIYYDSTTKKHYGHDGTTWNALY
jgi:hypothetical protein